MQWLFGILAHYVSHHFPILMPIDGYVGIMHID
jgi:hypothetical protein